jgi:hypothetical protein
MWSKDYNAVTLQIKCSPKIYFFFPHLTEHAYLQRLIIANNNFQSTNATNSNPSV